jgi:F-type H+-transporting ATPase subunit b
MDINATFIGQIIVFLIMLWFIARVVVPMMAAPIDARHKRIADGLAAAERGQKDLSEAASRVEELIGQARTRAQQIEQQAHTQANEIIDTAKRHAQTEGARIIEAAQQQVNLQVQRARDDLRKQVAGLAVAGAAKIIEREIDPRAHAQLLDELAGQI